MLSAMAATLADSFLADLDELDDDEDMRDAGGAGAAAEGAAELVAALTQAVQHNNLDSAAPLVNSDRYRRIMQARRRCPAGRQSRPGCALTPSRAAGFRRKWTWRWARRT